jgi:hypothetical protein
MYIKFTKLKNIVPVFLFALSPTFQIPEATCSHSAETKEDIGLNVGRNVSSYGTIIVVSINILYSSLDLDLGQLCCQGCIFCIFLLIAEIIRSMNRTSSRMNCDGVSNLLGFDPCSTVA